MNISQLKVLFIIVTSLLACIGFAYFAGSYFVPNLLGGITVDSAPTQKNSSSVGQRAPYFDLSDIHGVHVKLTDFSDAPLVIVFWATWNRDAADQIKILDDYLANQTTDENRVRVIAIDSQEEKSIVTTFMRRGGYLVSTLLDPRGVTSGEYGITGLPTLFFVDKNMVIVEKTVGILSERMLVDNIEKILQ